LIIFAGDEEDVLLSTALADNDSMPPEEHDRADG
jgi:hypothetical protein